MEKWISMMKKVIINFEQKWCSFKKYILHPVIKPIRFHKISICRWKQRFSKDKEITFYSLNGGGINNISNMQKITSTDYKKNHSLFLNWMFIFFTKLLTKLSQFREFTIIYSDYHCLKTITQLQIYFKVLRLPFQNLSK